MKKDLTWQEAIDKGLIHFELGLKNVVKDENGVVTSADISDLAIMPGPRPKPHGGNNLPMEGHIKRPVMVATYDEYGSPALVAIRDQDGNLVAVAAHEDTAQKLVEIINAPDAGERRALAAHYSAVLSDMSDEDWTLVLAHMDAEKRERLRAIVTGGATAPDAGDVEAPEDLKSSLDQAVTEILELNQSLAESAAREALLRGALEATDARLSWIEDRETKERNKDLLATPPSEAAQRLLAEARAGRAIRAQDDFALSQTTRIYDWEKGAALDRELTDSLDALRAFDGKDEPK